MLRPAPGPRGHPHPRQRLGGDARGPRCRRCCCYCCWCCWWCCCCCYCCWCCWCCWRCSCGQLGRPGGRARGAGGLCARRAGGGPPLGGGGQLHPGEWGGGLAGSGTGTGDGDGEFTTLDAAAVGSLARGRCVCATRALRPGVGGATGASASSSATAAAAGCWLVLAACEWDEEAAVRRFAADPDHLLTQVRRLPRPS